MRGAVVVAAVAALALASTARAEEPLRFETDDWHFTAPAALGTQADLELNARQAQRCTDEVEKLIGYRPASPQRFTWTWTIGGGPVSWATPTGVTSLVPSGESRLVDPVARGFREADRRLRRLLRPSRGHARPHLGELGPGVGQRRLCDLYGLALRRHLALLRPAADDAAELR